MAARVVAGEFQSSAMVAVKTMGSSDRFEWSYQCSVQAVIIMPPASNPKKTFFFIFIRMFLIYIYICYVSFSIPVACHAAGDVERLLERLYMKIAGTLEKSRRLLN